MARVGVTPRGYGLEYRWGRVRVQIFGRRYPVGLVLSRHCHVTRSTVSSEPPQPPPRCSLHSHSYPPPNPSLDTQRNHERAMSGKGGTGACHAQCQQVSTTTSNSSNPPPEDHAGGGLGTTCNGGMTPLVAPRHTLHAGR